MSPEQFEELKKGLTKTVVETVNGKIDKLNMKMDKYIDADNEWKDGVTPSIELMRQMQGFASIGGTILKAMVLIGAAVSAVFAFFKFIVHR